MWRKYEERCYAQYLTEAVDDTEKDAEHVYHTLKYQISMCTQEIQLNSDVKRDVKRCHSRVEQLGKLCFAHHVEGAAQKYWEEDAEMEAYMKTEILYEEAPSELSKRKSWIYRM